MIVMESPGAARILHGCRRGAIPHTHDAVTRGLRLGRHDGELLAHDGVEQGGLAHIRAAENSDGSGHAKRAVFDRFRFLRWVCHWRGCIAQEDRAVSWRQLPEILMPGQLGKKPQPRQI